MTKLEKLGIRGICNDWFCSYLSNRKQYLCFNTFDSDIKDIVCGVPQGSILGPILFLIYINDAHLCSKLKMLTFADDTTLYYSHSNVDTLFHIVNLEINKIYEWLCANKLSLNIKKKMMVFSVLKPSKPTRY